MKALLLTVVVAVLLATGCTNEVGARKVLEDQGYADIQFTGYRFWSCGEDYTFHTGFSAQSIVKRPVSGTVCQGWLKGASIKLDD